MGRKLKRRPRMDKICKNCIMALEFKEEMVWEKIKNELTNVLKRIVLCGSMKKHHNMDIWVNEVLTKCYMFEKRHKINALFQKKEVGQEKKEKSNIQYRREKKEKREDTKSKNTKSKNIILKEQ